MTEKSGEFFNPTNFLKIAGHDKKNRRIGFGGGNPSKIIPPCVTLEMYKETPIFIPVDIMERAVESVVQFFLGRSTPGGTDSEAL